MRIDLITLFPEMCETVLNESILGRAQKKGVLEINTHQLRDFAFDKHKRVDDTPYGGGKGMLMKAEPIALCFENICEQVGEKPYFVYMSPQGKTLNQQKLIDISSHNNVCVLCGHYEGVDQRVLDEYVDEEISIGDYVLTGGEIPAMVLIDTVSRYIEGVIKQDSTNEESFSEGLLEYPQYTRPEIFNDKKVPEVLLSGNHENIRKWRRKQSIKNTYKKRPELLNNLELSKEDLNILKNLKEGGK